MPGRLQEADVAHVTFVQGVADEVAPAELLRGWPDPLLDDDGPDPRADGADAAPDPAGDVRRRGSRCRPRA